MAADWRADRIGAAHRGENPTVMLRMPAGFAVIGDVQFLPGCCVMVTDDEHAQGLSDLSRPARRELLASTDALGEAVEIAGKERDPSFRRINIEIQGNHDPFLHAHIWPRYGWEPPEILRRPVATYPMTRWRRR